MNTQGLNKQQDKRFTKTITVTNIAPSLSENERAAVKRNIEKKLYCVFSKYCKKV